MMSESVKSTRGMKIRRVWVAGVWLALSLGASNAVAHGVHAHAIEGGHGVKAVFSDGTPMAFAPVTVYAPDRADELWQKGATDRQGQFLFLPDRPGVWRIHINDGLGHAVDREISVDDDGIAHVEHAHAHGGIWPALAGVGLLFGLFGVWSLARARRLPCRTAP